MHRARSRSWDVARCRWPKLARRQPLTARRRASPAGSETLELSAQRQLRLAAVPLGFGFTDADDHAQAGSRARLGLRLDGRRRSRRRSARRSLWPTIDEAGARILDARARRVIRCAPLPSAAGQILRTDADQRGFFARSMDQGEWWGDRYLGLHEPFGGAIDCARSAWPACHASSNCRRCRGRWAIRHPG